MGVLFVAYHTELHYISHQWSTNNGALTEQPRYLTPNPLGPLYCLRVPEELLLKDPSEQLQPSPSSFALYISQLQNPTWINTLIYWKPTYWFCITLLPAAGFHFLCIFFFALIHKNILYSYPISWVALQSYSPYVSFFQLPFSTWDQTYTSLMMSATHSLVTKPVR